MGLRIVRRSSWDSRYNENKIIVPLLAVSFVVHLFFLFVNKHDLFPKSQPLVEEWVIDADILPDFVEGESPVAALPDAKKASEARVSDRVLPQLPKRFQLDEEKKSSSENMAVPQDQDQPLVNKTDEQEKQKEKESLARQKEEEANRLKKREALRRLAIEKLRQQQKLARENEAQKRASIARLQSASTKNLALGGSVSDRLGLATEKKYKSAIYRHVHRFYALPEAYNLSSALLRTEILVRIDERGYLLEKKVQKSSGDKVFDDLALKAVKDAEPFPEPPKSLMGKEVILVFSTAKS